MNVIKWDGRPITEPGVYSGIPLTHYHSQDLCDGPSISSSGLRTIFSKSLRHFYDQWDGNPQAEQREPSKPMIQGQATHHLLLGEANFKKHYVVRPDELPDSKTGEVKAWQGNRTDCKRWLRAAADSGLTVLTDEMIDRIRGMAASLAAEPLVRSGILNGLIEHSIIYKDSETGVWVKVRPDAIPTSSLDMSDLKTAAEVTDDALEYSIGAYGYHQQGALVGSACQAVLGQRMTSFSLVFVESDRPHCARVKTLKDCDLELGEQQNRVALNGFARALQTGKWPGPGGFQTDAEYAEMKPFHRSRIESRLQTVAQEMAL